MNKTTDLQKWMARICLQCPLCRYARKKQRGVLYTIAKFESHICPFCRAYKKVYGGESWQPHDP